MKMYYRATQGVLLALTLAACGDPESTDRRGYTKAPLERAQPLITGEKPGEMAKYGHPNRVVAEIIELPQQAQPAGAAGQQTSAAANIDLPQGVTPEMVAQGEQIFSSGATCFTCHGAGGVGGPLGPALNDTDWIQIDGSFDALVEIINSGVPSPQQFPAPMPPRGGSTLTEEQVRQIAAYVYAISR